MFGGSGLIWLASGWFYCLVQKYKRELYGDEGWRSRKGRADPCLSWCIHSQRGAHHVSRIFFFWSVVAVEVGEELVGQLRMLRRRTPRSE
jgi:hypothetical protein